MAHLPAPVDVRSSRLTLHCVAGRRSISSRCLRIAALVWLLLAQFPLPVAHSHEAMGGNSLNTHLARHHQVGDCVRDVRLLSEGEQNGGVHWHWFMPCDFPVPTEDSSDLPHSAAFSPLGIWGNQGDSTLEDDVACLWDVLHLDARNCWFALEFPVCIAPSLSDSMPRHSFTQTYLDVPLCTLVCVSRT
ncbi:hypothetical protein Pla52o_19490 [Novipirellula galeiformis]|uniref:Uncharacterized protein n=1 Tax=Novipirellula galeiformis TaxID=2528004 RepID=A0A5C6CLK7_9BACT|nr:hypothetical protein [Novipirellula galeiformis]TWU24026.1 hypothetical protein Pla52o_19490 [Novipirellula galeiformis]